MFWRHNALGIAWAIFILILFGLPGGQFAKSKLQHADKVIHMSMFAVLYFQLCVGFIKQRTIKYLRHRTVQKVFAICVFYGAFIELMQGLLFVDRSVELLDMLFNALGCLVGLTVFYFVYGKEKYA